LQQVEQAKGTVKFFGWQVYQTPAFNSSGVGTRWTYPTSPEELITKAAVPGEFDVINTGSNQLLGFINAKSIVPLPTHLLTNYENVPLAWRNWFKVNGQIWGVPLQTAPSLMAYNTAKVPVATSMFDFLRPEYKGQIGLNDASTVVVFSIITALGDKTLSKPLTHELLDRAIAFLNKMKPNVKTFYVEGGEPQLMQAGDVGTVWPTYGGLVAQMQKANPKVKYNWLGSNSGADGLSLTPWADQAAALKWIDNALSGPVQKAITKNAGTLPVVPAGYAGLSGPGVLPIDQVVAASPALAEQMPTSPTGDLVTIGELTDAWNMYKESF
jgi:spermidine/putrescine-binding protein